MRIGNSVVPKSFQRQQSLVTSKLAYWVMMTTPPYGAAVGSDTRVS